MTATLTCLENLTRETHKLEAESADPGLSGKLMALMA